MTYHSGYTRCETLGVRRDIIKMRKELGKESHISRRYGACADVATAYKLKSASARISNDIQGITLVPYLFVYCIECSNRSIRKKIQ